MTSRESERPWKKERSFNIFLVLLMAFSPPLFYEQVHILSLHWVLQILLLALNMSYLRWPFWGLNDEIDANDMIDEGPRHCINQSFSTSP